MFFIVFFFQSLGYVGYEDSSTNKLKRRPSLFADEVMNTCGPKSHEWFISLQSFGFLDFTIFPYFTYLIAMRGCQLTCVLDKQGYYTLIHENAFIQKRFFRVFEGQSFRAWRVLRRLSTLYEG